MPRLYQSSWMSGADALAHVMLVANCDKPTAFKQLQLACGDGAVVGRGCGWDHQFAVSRGFDRGDEDWRQRFGAANPSAETLDNYLNTCEFDRASVLSTWSLNGIPGGGSGPPLPKRRKTNGNDYGPTDAPLIIEMRTLIETGEARSPEDAARMVVARAKGGGTAASKVKRLARRCRDSYPVQPFK